MCKITLPQLLEDLLNKNGHCSTRRTHPKQPQQDTNGLAICNPLDRSRQHQIQQHHTVNSSSYHGRQRRTSWRDFYIKENERRPVDYGAVESGDIKRSAFGTRQPALSLTHRHNVVRSNAVYRNSISLPQVDVGGLPSFSLE